MKSHSGAKSCEKWIQSVRVVINIKSYLNTVFGVGNSGIVTYLACGKRTTIQEAFEIIRLRNWDICTWLQIWGIALDFEFIRLRNCTWLQLWFPHRHIWCFWVWCFWIWFWIWIGCFWICSGFCFDFFSLFRLQMLCCRIPYSSYLYSFCSVPGFPFFRSPHFAPSAYWRINAREKVTW